MRTNDQEWALTAKCTFCKKSSRHEVGVYRSALWVCPECKKVHVILKHEDSVTYDHNDKKKKEELRQIYDGLVPEQK